jgi:signal transduction histidine kinase/CheY-like chemotaxis protein
MRDGDGGAGVNAPLVMLAIRDEQDVVLARQRARQVATLLGFDEHDQARIATAVSELARCAFQDGGTGEVEYDVDCGPTPALVVRVGDHASETGERESALVAARRLMDRVEIDTASRGSRIRAAKRLRGSAPSAAELERIAAELAREAVGGPVAELRQQNLELMRALDELQARRDELSRLNVELEDTNRGVVALCAELDQRAEELLLASEAKSRFLSNVSHELRTPLSSVLALSELLLQRADGPLTDEQERQVRYIREAGETLFALVNGLLDLARIEAGKTEVEVKDFEVRGLFASLRGMFRPLHGNPAVALVFEDANGLPKLRTDELKLAQVLRNLIANALKFTEQGEVRISATGSQDRSRVRLTVADTGIGIRPADMERIFDEFVQIESHQQRRVKGTGLGLPLSRRLTELLGGTLTVESEPGRGSTFTAEIPAVYSAFEQRLAPTETPSTAASAVLEGVRVLVIEDDEAMRYIVRGTLAAHGCEVLEAPDGDAGLRTALERGPHVVVLDLKLPRRDGLSVLRELRADPKAGRIPVIVHTAQRLDEDERAWVEQHADAILDKHAGHAEELVAAVFRAAAGTRA